MIKYLSKKIASYIVENDESADYEILIYGYDLLLQEIGVVIIVLLIAIPFGIFLHVLTTIGLYNILRSCAGGTHAKYRIACILTSFVILFVPAYLFAKTDLHLSLLAMIILYFIDLTLLLIYAPADTAIKPIHNQQKRKHMKVSAIIITTMNIVIAIFINKSFPDYASLIIVISSIVCCLTHPLAYKLYGCEKSIIKTEVKT